MLKRRPVTFFMLIFLPVAAGLAIGLAAILGFAPLLAWLIGANVSALGHWTYDKLAAGRGAWRVPELALHLMSALGASPAAFAGMYVLRHKSRTRSFLIVNAVLIVLQVAILVRFGEGLGA